MATWDRPGSGESNERPLTAAEQIKAGQAARDAARAELAKLELQEFLDVFKRDPKDADVTSDQGTDSGEAGEPPEATSDSDQQGTNDETAAHVESADNATAETGPLGGDHAPTRPEVRAETPPVVDAESRATDHAPATRENSEPHTARHDTAELKAVGHDVSAQAGREATSLGDRRAGPSHTAQAAPEATSLGDQPSPSLPTGKATEAATALEASEGQGSNRQPSEPRHDEASKPEAQKAESAVADNTATGQRETEQLHAFGNKERPRPPRPDMDFKVEADAWDAVVGPYAPTSPTEKVKGMSTYTDPLRPEVQLSGKYHRLPPDYQPPKESGLAIHADGKDVHPRAEQPWGHRTIYPTDPMTIAEFARRVAELPWEYAGNRKKEKRGPDGD